MKRTIVICILSMCLLAAAGWGVLMDREARERELTLEASIVELEQAVGELEQAVGEQGRTIKGLEDTNFALGQTVGEKQEQVSNLQMELIYLQNLAEGIEREGDRARAELNRQRASNELLKAEVLKWKQAYEQKPSVSSNLREFRTMPELTAWLVADGTSDNKYVPNLFDCDDFARMLQGNAMNDGYIISIIIVSSPGGGYHAKNACLIGNAFYFIEPQTDEHYFWGYVD